MASAKHSTDAGTDKWGVFLALGWDFNLRAWDARLASLPAHIGARQTALRHREGLLRALESRDFGAVEDKIELMMRTTTMAMHRRDAEAGVALNKARSTPRKKELMSWIENQLRRDSSFKSPDLWNRAPQKLKEDISEDRFRKRVTVARKKIKAAASQ